jgi:hypothetical protein
MYTKFHTNRAPELREQEIIAAIQFINCERKLNMQRNFFPSFSAVFHILFAAVDGRKVHD